MRVLWLAGWDFGAAPSGGSTYSLGLLGSLADAGVDVTVLHPGSSPESRPDVGWCSIGPLRPRTPSLVTRLPAMAFATSTPAYRVALRARLETDPPDVVVVDHLMMAWSASTLRSDRTGAGRPRIVFVSHNHERSVRAGAARARRPASPARVALEVDARKVARLEDEVVRVADVVTAITPEDADAFGGESDACVVLTPGYSGTRVTSRRIGSGSPRRAVIVGNFDWRVKRANLVRFLDSADPVLSRIGAHLRIVGHVPSAIRERSARRYGAVTFSGPVDSLDEELASARIGLVAEPVGGGFKLKALDYVFHRVPMAVLDGSVSGLPLRRGVDMIAAPTEPDLVRVTAAAIDDVEALDRLHAGAFDRCSPHFDWPDRGARLREAIERVGIGASR